MVEHDQTAGVQGFRQSIPPGSSLVALGVGVPRAVVGVEVTHDEGVIIVGGEEEVEIGTVAGGARGSGGNVDVDDIEGGLVVGDGEALVLDDGVTREQMIGG